MFNKTGPRLPPCCSWVIIRAGIIVRAFVSGLNRDDGTATTSVVWPTRQESLVDRAVAWL